MTEANPPAQPEELRRRILLYLSKADGQDDYRHLFQIATDFGETPKEIRDQLEILESQGLVDVDFFTNGNALPLITGKGKLEVEQRGQAAPQPDQPPISEPSPESQEFQPNKDYSVVIWRGKEYFLTDRQAKCVGLLHEAHTDGTRWLSGPDIMRKIAPTPKGMVSIRMSDIFRDSPAWNDGLVVRNSQNFYRLNL
jgi:hypothetical protein